MNKLDLIKKLLPGFLPLFVFIAADEVWGTEVGLIVAVVFGIAQLIYVAIREKRLDKFVLFDTGLIVILGLISVFLNNDIFFKLKPGLIGIILVAILGVSAFTPSNFLFNMSKRYVKGVEFSDEQVAMMKRSTKVMFFIFLFHTLLTFYSAFYMSKEAWAFISGGLFYILFGVYFLYELIKNRFIKAKLINSEEWLPVVDEKGKITGKATRTHVHSGSKLLHPVVHLHIINKAKQVYLQKRPLTKSIQPGKWDTAVGGHVFFNEPVENALKREAKEELNIELNDVIPVANYIWESEIEKELVFMFITKMNDVNFIKNEEVDDARFWSIAEIKKNLKKGIFTPNFELEFDILLKKILK